MYSNKEFFESMERQRRQIDKLTKPTADIFKNYGFYGIDNFKIIEKQLELAKPFQDAQNSIINALKATNYTNNMNLNEIANAIAKNLPSNEKNNFFDSIQQTLNNYVYSASVYNPTKDSGYKTSKNIDRISKAKVENQSDTKSNNEVEKNNKFSHFISSLTVKDIIKWFAMLFLENDTDKILEAIFQNNPAYYYAFKAFIYVSFIYIVFYQKDQK